MFEGSLKLDHEAHKDRDSELRIVDIGDFLPHKVKTDMCRVDESRFMIKQLEW